MCRIRYKKGSEFKVKGSGFERQTPSAGQITDARGQKIDERWPQDEVWGLKA